MNNEDDTQEIDLCELEQFADDCENWTDFELSTLGVI